MGLISPIHARDDPDRCISSVCLSVALYSGSAFAQHDHRGGTSHGAASHDSMNGASSGSAHRMTIDQQLSKNTQLSDKIQKLTGLPARHDFCGFKKISSCVAVGHSLYYWTI